MKSDIKEWIKFIVVVFIMYCILSIVEQVIPPRGIIGITTTRDSKNACNSRIVDINKALPASISGIQINDCIINVNGEDVREKSYKYTISKIKGEPDTTVKIKVARNNEEYEYTVQRVKNKIDWLRALKK